ncbi:hypothetical protein KPL78_09890 [Roseomonas sp. HJA6]|uniref:DUF748 domain-containing protein n=1 Tax=Roseomonas alba TaxID=2846776 RepID=A0ABS7A789_9PROT|nr:hypothetical protein [Neoroseomonas alba]MBW6398158.1 hypothetical protein [Neoroseomonas alba]
MLAHMMAAGFTAAAQQEGFSGMDASRSTGLRAVALATVAGLALTGGALAQSKPSPLGAPNRPALPTAKPPPLGAPAPMPVVPQQALPPRLAPQPPAAQAPAPVPPPSLAAPQVIPPNEPAAVTRLRGLLGPSVRLSYGSAQALDGTGEQVRLTAVVLERPGKRATIEDVQLNGLREDGVAEAVLRGFETTEDNAQVRIGMLRIAGLTVPRNAGGPPQPDQVRLEGLRLEGLRVSGAANVSVDLATVENWLPGQPGTVQVQGVAVTGITEGFVDAVRLARVAFSGVDIGGTIAALMRMEGAPSLPGRASFEMDGLELSAGGSPVGRLQEMRIAADMTDNRGSGSGTLALRGIRVEPLPMIAPWLTRFGYQAIEGEITAATSHDATTGHVEVRDFTIAARDVGTLTFSLNLDGLTQERVQSLDYSQARLIGAALGWADSSLYRRFIAMQAAQARVPEDQLREQFAAMAQGALSQPDATALVPIRDAVLRFIRGQATDVDIRVNPPKPIGAAEMQQVPQNPAELQRILGITATSR